MNIRKVKIIYFKEILETLRDRRTLISTILIPILLFPVLMFGMSAVVVMMMRKTEAEATRIALIGEKHASSFVSSLLEGDDFQKVEVEDLIARQIALFAGYRHSIKYGLKDILNKLDPTKVMRDELNQTFSLGPFKISRKYVPFFRYRRVFNNVVMNHELLSKYEQQEIEEKFFKSAFISGFLQSINSTRVHHKEE